MLSGRVIGEPQFLKAGVLPNAKHLGVLTASPVGLLASIAASRLQPLLPKQPPFSLDLEDSYTSVMNLEGATALVTGAATRIGQHIAQGLADAGVNVAITYRNSRDAALDTVDDLRSRGVNASAFELDLTEPANCIQVVEQVERGLGPVDVLVNNASSFTPTPFPTADHQGWYESFDVVLHGPYHLSNLTSPGMVQRGGGSIINLLDLSAWNPWPNRGAHSVAKAALLALTRQLSVELAPQVRANAIALGPTIPAARFTQEQVDHLARRTLTGAWGDPSQVASAVRFLIESDSITGECITVDSGERWAHVRNRFLDGASGGQSGTASSTDS